MPTESGSPQDTCGLHAVDQLCDERVERPAYEKPRGDDEEPGISRHCVLVENMNLLDLKGSSWLHQWGSPTATRHGESNAVDWEGHLSSFLPSFLPSTHP